MTRLRAVLASALLVAGAIALVRLTSGAAPTPALPPGHARLVIETAEGDRECVADGVRTRVYGPGTDGAEVMLVTIDGLGHHWAGGTSQAPEFLVGAPTDRLVATDVA